MQMKLHWLLFGAIVFGTLPSVLVAQGPQLLKVELEDQSVLGLPVHWGSVDAAVLDAAGVLHYFEVDRVQRHEVLPTEFRPQTQNEARGLLQRELGNTFETHVAGPYVVATPVGAGGRWKSRFLKLFAGYSRYFQVRGWAMRRLDFPLVVIVFPSRSQFRSYASQQGVKLAPNAIGSYFPASNRCVLYQIPQATGVDWHQTEATIVHEGVHQLAFNTGAHERLFDNPLWFVEGLAVMFEQPAVYDLGVARTSVADRLHTDSLGRTAALWQDLDRLTRQVAGLIASDAPFETDAGTAYALSWAMIFFLAENHTREMGHYMQLQAKRGFGAYSSAARRQDFEAAFGLNAAQLSSRMARFYEGLANSVGHPR